LDDRVPHPFSSFDEFDSLLFSVFHSIDVPWVVEVGVKDRGLTAALLEWAEASDAICYGIESAPSPDLLANRGQSSRFFG
jgi:hypothetical protein